MRLFSVLLVLALALRAEVPVRIEGEDHVRSGGPGKLRVIEREGTFGGKVLSYWDDHGTWAEWQFDVPGADAFAVTFRYAAAKPTARRLEIDGEIPAGFPAALEFPSTGTYAVFALHTASRGQVVPLSAGKHVLRMTNVDSGGLAVDAILLHGPSRRFMDQPLAAAEVARWDGLLPSGPSPAVLTGEQLARGSVMARRGKDGRIELAVAQTLFSIAGKDAEVVCRQTRNLSVRSWQSGRGKRLLISDGQAAYLLATGRGAVVELAPEVYRREGRLTWPAVWKRGDGQLFVPDLGMRGEAGPEWSLGGACISASAPLRPGTDGLRCEGTERIVAVKLAPAAWREAGMRLAVSTEGAVDTVLSSAQRLPGIAAFYNCADFQIRFVWDGDRLVACELLDLANGERISL